MKHRISAGALVVHNGKLLLVNHVKQGHYNFWVAPGGGVIGKEALQEAAHREVGEETGLDARVGKLAYVEETYRPEAGAEARECKFWFHAELTSEPQEISVDAPEAVGEGIVAAAFFTEEELSAITVPPPFLRAEFWEDLRTGSSEPKYLGVRKLEFW